MNEQQELLSDFIKRLLAQRAENDALAATNRRLECERQQQETFEQVQKYFNDGNCLCKDIQVAVEQRRKFVRVCGVGNAYNIASASRASYLAKTLIASFTERGMADRLYVDVCPYSDEGPTAENELCLRLED